MAGIGFVLRKLAGEDNLSGIIRAYMHSAIVAVGPWIMIIIALAFVTALLAPFTGFQEVNEFFAVILYNFLFSFMLTGPIYVIAARYVSDSLYVRSLHPIPGILIGSLVFIIIPALTIATLFYVFYATMSPWATLLSIINFVLLCEIWIVMLYLSLIRDFRAETSSWIISTILSIFLAIYLGELWGSEGMLLGFNIGFTYLVYAMIAHVFAEYPFPFRLPIEFRFYFKYYKGLFWSGLFLFASLWIDKVIMWWAPESVLHLNGLRTYPTYDGGMAISYLTIVPVMALFIFSLETNFYDSYIAYIFKIESNAPFFLIEEEKNNIKDKIIENGRAFLVLQGVLSLIFILLAPNIYSWIGMDFLQIGIFRIGTLGAFFAALNFCIVVFFSYFDSQDNMIKVTTTMLVSNIIFTLICLKLGFPFYGFGYCLSMILSFFVASILLFRFLDNLSYHIFITNVIKRQKIKVKHEDRFGLYRH